jgi:hypothetical protein
MYHILSYFIWFALLCPNVKALLKQQQSHKSIHKSLHSFKTSRNARTGTKLNSECISVYEELSVPTLLGIHFTDITPEIRKIVAKSGIQNGVVTVISRHTTAAITINEMEGRLVDDTRQFLLRLVPAACKNILLGLG